MTRTSLLTASGSALTHVSSSLSSEVVDTTATHKLVQLFHRPPFTGTSARRDTQGADECIYTFPLYESCAITSFTAHINNCTVRGVVQEKAKARESYEDAKSRGVTTTLLEQNPGDVFTTSVGAVPPDSVVRVVIEYCHGLRQDISGSEGALKLVVPTGIAPRYGRQPDDVQLESVWKRCYECWGHVHWWHGEDKWAGLEVEVKITMPGPIHSIESGQHSVAIHSGSLSPDASNGNFNPSQAHVKLKSSFFTPSTDFTLLIKSSGLDAPRALACSDPEEEGLTNLHLTLVPKFVLPQQRPELVFMVDRSGSMSGPSINAVRRSLSIFLASLPAGIHFNICSFGSHHSFLFEDSRPLDRTTLQTARELVSGMTANYGGTEIAAPLAETVRRRLKGENLEVLFLTDGEVWGIDSLLKIVNGAAKGGTARFFAMGMGTRCSHALVEGIARAGKGYAQTNVSANNCQTVVMRMLKAALTPHISDWRIDWQGKAALECTITEEKQSMQIEASAPAINPTVCLYDESVDPDAPPSPTGDNLPGLPEARRALLEAPFEVPPLYPLTRFDAYFVFSGPVPGQIELSGSFLDINTNSITPLNLVIQTKRLDAPTHSIRHAAGRAYIAELEQGRTPPFFPKNLGPSKLQALVKKEGTAAALRFGLASKWTSFIAVDEANRKLELEVRAAPPAPPHQLGHKARKKRSRDGDERSRGGSAHSGRVQRSARRGGSENRDTLDDESIAKRAHSATLPTATFTGMPESARKRVSPPEARNAPPKPKPIVEVVARLAELQEWDGSWVWTEELARLLGASRVGDGVRTTVLVIVWLNEKAQDSREVWDLMVGKARSWVQGTGADVDKLEEECRLLVSSDQ